MRLVACIGEWSLFFHMISPDAHRQGSSGCPVWNVATRLGILSYSWRPIMLRSSVHPIVSVLASVFLLTPSSFAFDTPLSDQAVREAYFLGQRGDETMATFLNKYTKILKAPKTGPDIA